jgi:hypothetical protein
LPIKEMHDVRSPWPVLHGAARTMPVQVVAELHHSVHAAAIPRSVGAATRRSAYAEWPSCASRLLC